MGSTRLEGSSAPTTSSSDGSSPVTADSAARRLIVNADDLGLSPGVNRGILESAVCGVVTSTTAMTNMPFVQAGLELIRQNAPHLGVGLHLNLSYGRPLSDPAEVPSLVRGDGQFVSVSRGIASSRRWQPGEVKLEFSAQLERFVALTETLPDHLDSHQMVGSLSAVCREVMLDLAETHALPMRRGGREAFRLLEREAARRLYLTQPWMPPLLGTLPWQRYNHIYDRVALEPDHFEIGFFDSTATVETLLRILGELPAGVTELVCHPGYLDEAADGYKGREVELAALTDARVAQKVTAEGVELTTFAALRRTLSR